MSENRFLATAIAFGMLAMAGSGYGQPGTQSEATHRERAQTTLGDVVVSKYGDTAKDKVRLKETGLGGPDTVAELDKSSTKLQESRSRAFSNQKPGAQRPFVGTTLDGGDIRTKGPTKNPTGLDLPKPDIKAPVTTAERPKKADKPKRANRRPNKRH